ncbi:hypothetical protein PHBOTO_002716 [Pseudozyma hubeiensis]|nr:hypothetical protein PHBOTO_002716 [Pseudozyma hubeiensis]
MERNFAFVPPPFLGTSFRQNHQIRSLKSNSYPFLPTHRSLQPSSSHTSPSTALLTSRSLLPGFARSNLTSFRRKHLRRCYDLLHLSIQRGEWLLAGKFLRVLMAAHEWTDDSLWRTALLILSHSTDEDVEGKKIGYLQQLDLESSAPFKATATTPNLIRAYIASNRLNDAIELLEQRVNVHPYKSQPELHAMLGMLYLYIGITTLLNTEGSGEGVELRKLDRSTKGRARQCFETALQAKEGWVRGEKGRRQRIWGMRRRDVDGDQAWVDGKRGVVWGRDWEEQDWEDDEHEDLKRVRRRLDGEEVEVDERSDAESSASGSVYSNHPAESSDDDEEEEEERGRTRSRHKQDSDEEQNPPLEPDGPPKGPKAWSAAWPQVSSFFTPDPPLAYHLAEQFLTLLGRPSSSQHASQSTATTHGRDTARRRRVDGTPGSERRRGGGVEEDTQSEASADVGVDGIQLTREEAEARLRRILFEDAEPERENGDEVRGGVKRERKREKVVAGGEIGERKEKRKSRQERDRTSSSGKRRRREERF